MTQENKDILLKLLKQHKELGISEQIDYDKFYLYSIITHSTAIEGSTVTEEDFGTFLPCSSLSAFPLTFRLLLPTFRQQACITVLPPLCRMPQCHRQVIALLVARTVRH